jgi:hypothetical protein
MVRAVVIGAMVVVVSAVGFTVMPDSPQGMVEVRQLAEGQSAGASVEVKELPPPAAVKPTVEVKQLPVHDAATRPGVRKS